MRSAARPPTLTSTTPSRWPRALKEWAKVSLAKRTITFRMRQLVLDHPGRDGQDDRGRARQELLRRHRRDPARAETLDFATHQPGPQGERSFDISTGVDIHTLRQADRRASPASAPSASGAVAHVDTPSPSPPVTPLRPQARPRHAVCGPADCQALQGGRPARRRLQRRLRQPAMVSRSAQAPRH